MAYFSLFYENLEQEAEAKKQAQNQIYYRGEQKTEKKTYFVGARMVVEETAVDAANELPCFFRDLNLEAVLLSRYEGTLPEGIKELLFSFPKDLHTITYRQEIYKELDNPVIFQGMTNFRNDFSQVLRLLMYSTQSDTPLQQSKYYLDAAVLYYECINGLYNTLKEQARSAALNSLLSLLKAQLDREGYYDFFLQAARLNEQLENIHCTLTMAENAVRVSFAKDPEDFGRAVQKVFRLEDSPNNSIRLFNQPGLNPFESKLISLVEKEYPRLCRECLEFAAERQPLADETLMKLYRESEFYMSGHLLAAGLREKGFPLTYPVLKEQSSFYLQGICDINLALSAAKAKEVTLNDLLLQEGEGGAFVTGVNQGGKTTYARSIGQTAFLAVLGMPVIAKKALLPHLNGIYTHFTTEENCQVNNGKLLEELHHLKEVLEKAPANCLYILNEMFSSTTAADACDLTKLLLPQLFEKSGTVICVTHVPELASRREGMISLVAAVKEEDGYQRTYRICNGEAALSARAIDIALKYHLSGNQIKERIANGN
ncbi:MutS-related protein [Anaerocolumna jejuensis]|uniref:MutS-related protein n=1 Tax=Anaerocolumna jejuensis TaxID=259063 RepID=UPI003F7BAE11